VDTAPLGNLQNNNNIKLQNNQRNNLVSTERLALKKGQSSENVQASDKQTEETGASSPFGTMNLGFGGSTNSLKVQSAQQFNNNFKSSQGLRSLQSSTNMNLGNNNTAAYNNTKKEKGKTDICVKKWVDYSTKYGMGYLLSNGTTGVFFNDSTKIILDSRTL